MDRKIVHKESDIHNWVMEIEKIYGVVVLSNMQYLTNTTAYLNYFYMSNWTSLKIRKEKLVVYLPFIYKGYRILPALRDLKDGVSYS